MDLEDNETAMNSADSQVDELKTTIASLEAELSQNQTQMSELESRLEESKAQVRLRIDFNPLFNRDIAQTKDSYHILFIHCLHSQKGYF